MAPVGKPSGWYQRRTWYTNRVLDVGWVCTACGLVFWLLWRPALALLFTASGLVLALWAQVYIRGMMAALQATVALLHQRGACGHVHRDPRGRSWGCELYHGHPGRHAYTVDITAAVKAGAGG